MNTRVIAAFGSLSLILFAGAASAANREMILERDAAERFATLPDGVRFPEGLAVSTKTGDVFVGTFDFGPNPNKLLRFDKGGHLVAQKDFDGQPLLGLLFNAADNKVYICNFGTQQIQRIRADFNAATPVEVVAAMPIIGPPAPRNEGNPDGSQDVITFGSARSAPNALVFDKAGNLFVSDSFQGAIFKIAAAAACTGSCVPTVVKHDGLLATAGFPPFGANGLAFSRDEKFLFVANTGDDRVLKLETSTTNLTVFAESINGADGLVMGDDGTLWVAANQADEIVGLNANGRPIAKLGEFVGIDDKGRPRGLLFPASPAILKNEMFVTNLALPLTPAVGDEWEEDVTRWTVSRLRVPEVKDK